MRQVAEILEDEAIRRAVEGVPKGVHYQGQECGTETVYSDGILMFLLRGANPEKYRERTGVSGKVDVVKNSQERWKSCWRHTGSWPADGRRDRYRGVRALRTGTRARAGSDSQGAGR